MKVRNRKTNRSIYSNASLYKGDLFNIANSSEADNSCNYPQESARQTGRHSATLRNDNFSVEATDTVWIAAHTMGENLLNVKMSGFSCLKEIFEFAKELLPSSSQGWATLTLRNASRGVSTRQVIHLGCTMPSIFANMATA